MTVKFKLKKFYLALILSLFLSLDKSRLLSNVIVSSCSAKGERIIYRSTSRRNCGSDNQDFLDTWIKAETALTRDNDARGMADLALPVSGDAGVIANVLGLDRREPELGAVVEYPDVSTIGFDGIRILVPKDLWRWSTLSLAVEYYRIAQIHVYHIIRRYAESGWRCK